MGRATEFFDYFNRECTKVDFYASYNSIGYAKSKREKKELKAKLEAKDD